MNVDSFSFTVDRMTDAITYFEKVPACVNAVKHKPAGKVNRFVHIEWMINFLVTMFTSTFLIRMIVLFALFFVSLYSHYLPWSVSSVVSYADNFKYKISY